MLESCGRGQGERHVALGVTNDMYFKVVTSKWPTCLRQVKNMNWWLGYFRALTFTNIQMLV